MNKLALIVPCYNEEEIIEQSCKTLLSKLDNLINDNLVSQDSFICFVNDGSIDNTWNILTNLINENKNGRLRAISFSCNFGHQNAMLAGLCENDADIYITLDADLQDDISVIGEMVEKYNSQDIDVVYGVRNDRTSDSFCKRFFAETFYKLNSVLGVKSLYNHADFRLINNNVVEVLKRSNESILYFRALIYKYSFKHDIVYYKREKRIGGTPKYNFFSSLNLALRCLVSFGAEKLNFMILIFSLSFFIFSMFFKSFNLLLGSIILFSLYINGLFLSQILIEVKNRPRYYISKRL